ncbi:PREDICTED: uncharacterized protein LOC106742755 [Dinoponera quadriceps]|uniref:Uncharacterized protein LOC106742755 n=1 Tax=Dinoponera quadriceps TaxID=609295 RepID=A0A6P3WZI3_DINQU|nr:PREDICTED: uncharacterized protein LOC106742755 [Dinoponera quadriceps]
MPDDYNNFFNPNICHVCKTTDNGSFVMCDQCYMVSYCGGDHREVHRSSHTEICAAIKKLLKKESQWDACPLNLQDWIQLREEFLRSVKTELSRELMSHEVQMIRFAKSCLICHQQTNLYTCMICHSANYCVDHAEIFNSYHSYSCKELLLCLSLDIDLFHGMGSMMKFTKFPNEGRPCINMDTFVKHYVQRTHTSRELDDWHFPEYFYSDYASGPLTLYYGMEDTNLIDSLNIPEDACYVIHIIDAKFVDRKYVLSWEIFLHLLRYKINGLKIVLIGSELQNECNNMKFCSRCNHMYSQKLSFESYHTSYHSYVASESYKQPNVIVGFEADLSNGEAWSESILKLREQNCPLLLTTKSKLKAERNINGIQEVLGTSLIPLYNDNNKFGSRRPWRDVETNYVYFRNSHLIIYRSLYN